MKWDYILTIRKNYRVTKKGIRRLIDKIGEGLKNTKSIERLFIVGERDFTDWENFHSHILISTTGDEKGVIKFLREILGEKDNIHSEPVIDDQSVGIYLTKFIGKDIDYDIFIN